MMKMEAGLSESWVVDTIAAHVVLFLLSSMLLGIFHVNRERGFWEFRDVVSFYGRMFL